jgi:AcrR family transcriptional regulator
MSVNLVGPGQSPTDDSAIRRRIMRAAEELFKKLGFRAVTMEAVARDAAVAKATLYGHVRNKDELFRAVCERMALRMTRSFVGELRAEHRTVDARVRAAILGKQQLMLALVRGSPHSSSPRPTAASSTPWPLYWPRILGWPGTPTRWPARSSSARAGSRPSSPRRPSWSGPWSASWRSSWPGPGPSPTSRPENPAIRDTVVTVRQR